MSDPTPNPHGPWPFPAILNVEMVPLHESINPDIKLTSNWPKLWIATNVEAGERRCYVCHAWKSAAEFAHDANELQLQRKYQCKDCDNADKRCQRANPFILRRSA